MGLQHFTRAYFEAALWSSTDDTEQSLVSRTLAAETDRVMRAEAAAFYEMWHAHWAGHHAFRCGNLEDAHAGHDFWMTRNGHGVGFWDGDWIEPAATVLTEAATAAGVRELYVGDDGLVYMTPCPGQEVP